MRLQAVTVAVAIAFGSAYAAESMDVGKVEKSVEKAAAFLMKRQAADGSYGKYAKVGETALVIAALADSHLKLREANSPHVAQAVQFILTQTQPNGGIYDPKMGLGNYNTSLAILMLVALENPRHHKVIDNAQKYIVGIQRKTDPKKDNLSGGIGYTKDKDRPDLSNTHWAVEALKAAQEAGVEVDPQVFERTLVFVKRCQNDGEVSDLAAAAVVNDGGATYRPGDSKAGEVTKRGRKGWRSYGSITYAMLKAYIHCGLKKNDPAVRAALKWISNNYTLDENPGMKQQGQYYYYVTFAKALAVYGKRYVKDQYGQKHDWAVELATKLLELQSADGSWVNPAMRWMENDPVLVTAYAVTALNICRDQLASRERKK